MKKCAVDSALELMRLFLSIQQSWTWVWSRLARVGTCRVGSQNSPSSVGRFGSGPVSKISNKYTTYTQETDYSTAIIHNDKL